MTRWQNRSGAVGGSDYDKRWQALEEAGESIHGEADLVATYRPGTVLDAGCGTGRVAIELSRRGIAVVGVDLDEHMLGAARAKAPELDWVCADLTTVSAAELTASGDGFDVVVMAGNVMIFVAPGTEADVVANLADHLVPGGRLIAGFQLAPGGYGVDRYDEAAATAGLVLEDRWSTWERDPFRGGDYAVSVHRRP